MAVIESTLDGFIGTVTLNNTANQNVLSTALLPELVQALDKMGATQARAIVLRSRGDIWSVSQEVRELPAHSRDRLAFGDPLQEIIHKIQHLPVPVIAMLQGPVWGGACEVVMSCDILVGTHQASFTMTAARIGVPFSASGLLQMMSILPVNVIREMFFTAQPITAEQARNLGVLNHLVPGDSIEEFTYGLARKIAANSPLSIRVIKEQIRLLASAQPVSPLLFEHIQSLRCSVYDSEDYTEGLRAVFEKREPVFQGK